VVEETEPDPPELASVLAGAGLEPEEDPELGVCVGAAGERCVGAGAAGAEGLEPGCEELVPVPCDVATLRDVLGAAPAVDRAALGCAVGRLASALDVGRLAAGAILVDATASGAFRWRRAASALAFGAWAAFAAAGP
jgi:hypothetical protein